MKDDDVILISAYLDDELSQKDRADVERRLEADPEFSTLFSEFEQLDGAITQSASAIDDKPIPAELQALLDDTSNNVEPISVPKQRTSFTLSRFLPLAAAVATVAIAIPLYLGNQTSDDIVVADVLNTGQSGQEYRLSNDALMRITMTFENNDSQVCREYLLAENNSSNVANQTIACRENQNWEEVITASVALSADGSLQPASAQTDPEIEAWLDQNMASDAFTIEQEKAVLTLKE